MTSTLQEKQYHFAQQQVLYLDHVVFGTGSFTLICRKLRQFGVPNPYKSEHGEAVYWPFRHRFVQGYATITEPLYKLTRKASSSFQWSEPQVNISYPNIPRFDKPFLFYIDASNTVTGATQDDVERVIAY